ncbi:hypothetical protein ACQ4PT_034040 [Festuca glaucescens]
MTATRGTIRSTLRTDQDRTTKVTILEGKCQGGLYPVPAITRRQVFHTTKPSQDIWHRRLGHPSSQVVASILRSNKLESSSFALGEPHVCDACQQAKARQLPFELSTRVSTEPLALVHSDVWGPPNLLLLYTPMYGGLQ